MGVYNNLKMINKPDNTHITQQKKKCISLLNKLTLIGINPEVDFFDSNLRSFFNDQFSEKESMEKCKDWSVMNHKWRMFYVVYEFLEEK